MFKSMITNFHVFPGRGSCKRWNQWVLHRSASKTGSVCWQLAQNYWWEFSYQPSQELKKKLFSFFQVCVSALKSSLSPFISHASHVDGIAQITKLIFKCKNDIKVLFKIHTLYCLIHFIFLVITGFITKLDSHFKSCCFDMSKLNHKEKVIVT